MKTVENNNTEMTMEQRQADAKKQMLKIMARTKECFVEMDKAKKSNNEARRREFRNEVIEMNIRLVPHMLKKYRPYTDDQYQAGCIGLLKAADKYDIDKRVPFHNFACLVIEREIQMEWKKGQRSFDAKMDAWLTSLDCLGGSDGDSQVQEHERIADEAAQAAFAKLEDDEGLDMLFKDVIIPILESQKSRAIDFDKWLKLEVQYLVELSQENSSRQRLTFSEMAKQLGTTVQNMRTKHHKCVKAICDICIQRGLYKPLVNTEAKEA